MQPASMRGVTDRDGITVERALAAHGVELNRAKRATRQLRDAAAYLELHIEQGPVLESVGKPMGVVLGTFGVERHAIRFTGQAAHAGSTPMAHRRDALAGVSRLHLAVREIAVKHDGVCTVGKVTTEPGIVTAVAGQAEMLLDQRHLEARKLARLYADARRASERIAKEERINVEWHKMWAIQPFLFHRELTGLAEDSIKEVCGTVHRLPSGPLHDAAEVCRAGVPTAMLFVQSLRGISHNKIEDTKERHLAMAVRALDGLAERTVAWITRPTRRADKTPTRRDRS
jgi:N-carbamoyl-L-amino-acid hydrolase